MTAADARISTALPSHPKTKKLIRRLGVEGAWALVCLFLWAASNRSDGDLSGLTDEDIELAADWGGAEGALIEELAKVRLLDGEAGTRAIHDWAEHNPWAAGAKMRSQKAQWNAAKRHHGVAEANRLVPEYALLRDAASIAGSTSAAGEDGAGGMQSDEDSIAPSPSPSPSPSPIPTSRPYGGEAPRKRSAAEQERSQLWAALKTALVDEQTCSDVKAAGVLLGKQASKYGNDVFIEACRETLAEPRVGTYAYLIAICETTVGKRPGRQFQTAMSQNENAMAYLVPGVASRCPTATSKGSHAAFRQPPIEVEAKHVTFAESR